MGGSIALLPLQVCYQIAVPPNRNETRLSRNRIRVTSANRKAWSPTPVQGVGSAKMSVPLRYYPLRQKGRTIPYVSLSTPSTDWSHPEQPAPSPSRCHPSPAQSPSTASCRDRRGS